MWYAATEKPVTDRMQHVAQDKACCGSPCMAVCVLLAWVAYEGPGCFLLQRPSCHFACTAVQVGVYLNRLSDYLFTAARFAVRQQPGSRPTTGSRAGQQMLSCQTPAQTRSVPSGLWLYRCTRCVAVAASDWCSFIAGSWGAQTVTTCSKLSNPSVCRLLKRASLRLYTRRQLDSVPDAYTAPTCSSSSSSNTAHRDCVHASEQGSHSAAWCVISSVNRHRQAAALCRASTHCMHAAQHNVANSCTYMYPSMAFPATTFFRLNPSNCK